MPPNDTYYDSVAPHQSSGKSKRRSEPIAIKDQGRSLKDEIDREMSEKEFYDGRTWSMFHRIAEHRLNSLSRALIDVPIDSHFYAQEPITIVKPEPRYAYSNGSISPNGPSAPPFDDEGAIHHCHLFGGFPQVPDYHYYYDGGDMVSDDRAPLEGEIFDMEL